MGGASINLRGCGGGPPALDETLGAVLPGARTLFGLDDMTCVPEGFNSLVPMMCSDGVPMPACSTGRQCGAANSAAHQSILAKISAALESVGIGKEPGAVPVAHPTIADTLSSHPLAVGVVAIAALGLIMIAQTRGRW